MEGFVQGALDIKPHEANFPALVLWRFPVSFLTVYHFSDPPY